MFTGETAAPLEHPLEQISSTTALFIAVPFVYNIGYTDPSVCLSSLQKKFDFFPSHVFSDGGDHPQGRC